MNGKRDIKGSLAAGAIVLAAIFVSWLGACAIWKAITWCFGLNFEWAVATGVWFILILLKSVFGGTDK